MSKKSQDNSPVESLEKAPIQTMLQPGDASEFAENAAKQIEPMQQGEAWTHSSKINNGGNTYHHHVFKVNNRPLFRHVLSESPHPFHKGFAEIRGVDDGDGLEIGLSVIRQTHKGKGLGTQLYKEQAKHHGTIFSDQYLSPSQEQVYKKIHQDPEFHAEFGQPFTTERHAVFYKKHPRHQ